MQDGKLLVPSKEVLGILIAVCSIAFYIYRLGFPRPLAGIAYNPEAARRFFGDVVLFPKANAPAPRAWLGTLGERLQSPLVQVFIRPYGRPALVLYDYWEAYDINNRRTDEFDKTERNAQIFSLVVPQNHTSMRASHPAYARSKDMIKGVMVPSFVSEINAPEMYAKAMATIKLWATKADMACGHPFSVSADVRDFAFDAVLAASFGQGEEESIVAAQMRHLANGTMDRPVPDENDMDAAVEFPSASVPLAYDALTKVTESLAYAMRAVFPKQEMWLRQTLTEMGTHYRRKDEFLRRKIDEAAERLGGHKADEEDEGKHGGEEGRREENGRDGPRRRSALDHFVLQEFKAAAKAGRAPDFLHGPIRDELLGYIIAGHDSSTSALSWMLKYLTQDAHIQHNLRQHLRVVHADAWSGRRHPTAAEIARCRAPYLDAVIQEVFRCAYTTPFSLREATRDTHVLGHFVPKGTIVWFSTSGPSFIRPNIDVKAEHLGPLANADTILMRRKADQDRVPPWAADDIANFRPERWLRPLQFPSKSDSHDFTYSHVEFNPNAGPMMAFGSGPRGCCGKRLIYLSMRILITLVLWDFELLACPPGLSSTESNHATASHPKQCYVRLRKIAESAHLIFSS